MHVASFRLPDAQPKLRANCRALSLLYRLHSFWNRRGVQEYWLLDGGAAFVVV